MKTLLAILFLTTNFNLYLQAEDVTKIANVIILDKTSSTKYELLIDNNSTFRSLNFKILACSHYNFEKYKDDIALITIYDSNSEDFTGWFFSKTEELNTYSDKIYEISLLSCG
ncbi:DUF2155 domain-containing protein [Alphaproteobacteria bacterium]|nr:DUF2155 domain-containing protein [Alphaproteobacteria bacterium]